MPDRPATPVISKFHTVVAGIVTVSAILVSSAPAYGTSITGQAVPTSAVLGASVQDTATLVGGIPPVGGAVTFRLYSDESCTSEVFMSVSSLSGPSGRDASSGDFNPAAVGIYHWTAAWAGDMNNPPAGPTACLDDNQRIEMLAPTPPTPPGADTTPPETVIDSKKLKGTSAKFRFTSTEPASTFECKLDKRSFKPCVSPKKYKNLSDGRHKFQVRAVDVGGNLDGSPAEKTFKI